MSVKNEPTRLEYQELLLKNILESLKRITEKNKYLITIHYAETSLSSYFYHFLPFNFHNGIYCRTIKSNNSAWMYCTQCQEKVFNAVKNRGAFCGVCWAGVKEAIIPIKTIDNEITAFFSVSGYAASPLERVKSIDKANQFFGLGKPELRKSYSTLSSSMPSLDEIEKDLNPIGHMLSLLFALLDKSFEHKHYLQSHEAKYGEVLHYIRRNFRQSINIKILAEHFHYGYASLCRLFKDQGKTSFSCILNEIRVEAAKKYLELTDESITIIAGYVGYSDANYFSVQFKKQTGLTPSEYRKQYMIHSANSSTFT